MLATLMLLLVMRFKKSMPTSSNVKSASNAYISAFLHIMRMQSSTLSGCRRLLPLLLWSTEAALIIAAVDLTSSKEMMIFLFSPEKVFDNHSFPIGELAIASMHCRDTTTFVLLTIRFSAPVAWPLALSRQWTRLHWLTRCQT